MAPANDLPRFSLSIALLTCTYAAPVGAWVWTTVTRHAAATMNEKMVFCMRGL